MRLETSGATGLALYDVRFWLDTVYNFTNVAWENYSPSNWAQYPIVLTESAQSGRYSVDLPAQALLYPASDFVYRAFTGSPQISDAVPGPYSVGQAQGVNLASINNDLTAVANLATSAKTMITGAAAAGTLSTTQMTTTLTASTSNLYNGRTVIWTSGALTGTAAAITSYDGSTKKLGFTSVPLAPGAADTFVIL